MDTASSSVPSSLPPSVSVAALAAHTGAPDRPWVFDVRRDPAYDADPQVIAGAQRARVETIVALAGALPPQRPVIVYCVHGHEVSQQAASALRAAGVDAHFLEGGIEAWRAQHGPTVRRQTGAGVPGTLAQPSQWITRERPKIDRIACPWLVRRFIDPGARFLYVPAARVTAEAARTGAIPYDVDGVQFTHRGERCSFDAFIDDFGIDDAPLARVADIVRAVDTGRPGDAPQAAGLLAISQGLSALHADDLRMLELGLQVYDALYAWAARQAAPGRYT
jgi:rhodanese-related sulfurtransferase